MRAQDLLVEQVLHADADARVLVDVARADAAAGGADLVLAELLLVGAVEEQVVRHDEVGVAADAQVVAADAARPQRLELAEQDVRVDDDAVADDAGLGLVEDAGGDEVELELLAVAHDGVAGVVAALEAHDHVGLLGQQVGDLAFAFVAPLGADHDRSGHGWLLLPCGLSAHDGLPVAALSGAVTGEPAAFRMLRAAITPAAEACTRPRVTPAPSPTAYRFLTGVCRPSSSSGRAE